MKSVAPQDRGGRFAPSLLPRSAPSGDRKDVLGQTGVALAIRNSVFWSAAGTIVFRLSNIVVMAFVARILAPDQFGIFALAVTVHAFTVSVAEFGVAAAVARSDLDIERIAPTVTTISIAASVSLAAPMMVFAEPLALLLGSGEAASSIRILSIGVALIGPFAVPGALLQRDFRQRTLFKASVCGFVPGSAVLLWSSLTGGGVEGLAWSRVLAQLITGSVMIASSGRIFKPGLDLGILAPLLGFGIPLALSNLLSQVLLNVDNIFIGRMLGVAELGTYSIAFAVSVWSTAVVGSMLNAVVLPGVTAVVRDGGDIRSAVLSATGIVAWVAAPIAAFSIAFAQPLIVTVYGPQWAAGGPVLAALASYGLVFVLGLLFANIIIATGHTVVLFWVQVAALIALLPALPLGIQLAGSVGAGWAHVVVVSLVTLPVYLGSLRRVSGIRILSLVREIGRPLLAAGGCAAVAWLATKEIQPSPLSLGAGFLICGTGYGLITRGTFLRVFPSGFGLRKLTERR
jgi:lipopolysaccharide exporter